MAKNDKLITLAPMTMAEARMLSDAWAIFAAALVGDVAASIELIALSVDYTRKRKWEQAAEDFTGNKMQPILDAVIEDTLGPERAAELDKQVNAELAAETLG